MNISPATVYPDVDAAAHIWTAPATVNEDSDSWFKDLITKYCDSTLSVIFDDSLTDSYKVGYSKAYIKAIKRLIDLHY